MALKKSLLAVLAVVVLLVAPLPFGELKQRWPSLVGELENATHILLFAGLAWILFRASRQIAPRLGAMAYPLTFAIVVGFGLAMEVVQAMVGRDSAWIDVANDAAGALAALLFLAGAERRASSASPLAPRLMLSVAAVAILAIAFLPLARTLAAYGCRTLESPVLWRTDSRLLRPFTSWYFGRRHAFEVREIPLDHGVQDVVEVDLRNLSNQPLRLRVRLRGTRDTNRNAVLINRSIALEPLGQRTLGISRKEILATSHDPAIDLTSAGRLVVIQDTIADRPLFRVDELRLARAP